MNNMKDLRFDTLYAVYSGGDLKTAEEKRLASLHPVQALKELGIKYFHATPQTMGDQFWFWNCTNVPDELPPYLSLLGLDPRKCSGVSEDVANKIIENRSTND